MKRSFEKFFAENVTEKNCEEDYEERFENFGRFKVGDFFPFHGIKNKEVCEHGKNYDERKD